MEIFKVSTEEEAGENWDICWFGMDTDNHEYSLTTNRIHASELWMFSKGAKADAELVCKLLNAYWGRIIEEKRLSDFNSGLAIPGDNQQDLLAAVAKVLDSD